MFVTKLPKTKNRAARVLTAGRTKKAAVDALLTECKTLTGGHPAQDAYEVVEEMDLALVWRLPAAAKKLLADGKGIIIKPL